MNNDDCNNKEDPRQQTNNSKPEYEDELERHGQSDTVAMDVQLIKGVLPDLFAILKFLESNDDWVFDGTICCYFLKKLQVAESKKLEWWKRLAPTPTAPSTRLRRLPLPALSTQL